LIINDLTNAAGLYRNEASAPRVAVRLRGRPPNTKGIDAKIVVSGGPVTQAQQVVCGGRYLSGDDAMRVFAAGSLTVRLKIEVTWRNGKRTIVQEAQPNCLYEISEAGLQTEAPGTPSETSP